MVQKLQTLFESKCIRKQYRALVHGSVAQDTEGCLDDAIDGKAAQTRYRFALRPVELPDGWVSTVDLWPLTGRRHQLRKHMAYSLEHPIVGDRRYGGWQPGEASQNEEEDCDDDSDGEDCPERNIFCLWALGIEFPHPAQSRAADHADESASDVQACDVEVGVPREEWENFRLNFSEPPQKKKRKAAKASNVIGATCADGAKVKCGDLLIAVNNEPVTVGAEACAKVDAAFSAGTEATLTFRRSASRVRIEIPEPSCFQLLRTGTKSLSSKN
eukprot:TRINITY_DN15004_c0_g2_i6.p2 TRINITY_DN15004_c0_g2~~TRINITY_DN15004_c0_g2_i6.p2  ORF type:complete len:272 (+),score=28.31 TRINITY_DN15004_c0_g2_i6:616-1431(+)